MALSRSHGAAVAAAIAAALLTAASSANAVTITPVALSGVTPIPTVGGTFSSVFATGINANGTVLFGGPTGGPSDFGVYTANAGTITEIARSPVTVLPGTGGQTAAFLGQFYLNPNDDIAFTAYYGATDTGFFTRIAGTTAPVALSSSGTAPGTSAAFTNFQFPAMNAAGKVAFRADYATGTGFFTNAGGALVDVARSDGADVPNMPGVKFTNFGSETLNASGRAAFNGFHSDTTSGIYYSDNGGPIQVVAQRGVTTDPVSGLTLNSTPVPTLSANGDILFSSGTNQGSGIYRYHAGALSRVAAVGDAAPSTSSTFSDVYQGTADANGNAIFIAPFNSGADVGLFSTVGGLHAITLSTSGNAPGASTFFHNFEYAVLAPTTGQAAFIADLDNLGSVYGLWVTDPISGIPVSIVRVGDSFDFTGTGTMKTVSDVWFQYNLQGEGGAQPINDNGTFMFNLEFTDGSTGVYTGQVSAVPEPTSLPLLVLGTAIFVRRPNRTRAIK